MNVFQLFKLITMFFFLFISLGLRAIECSEFQNTAWYSFYPNVMPYSQNYLNVYNINSSVAYTQYFVEESYQSFSDQYTCKKSNTNTLLINLGCPSLWNFGQCINLQLTGTTIQTSTLTVLDSSLPNLKGLILYQSSNK